MRSVGKTITGMLVVMTKSDFRDREAHANSDRFFADEIVARLQGD